MSRYRSTAEHLKLSGLADKRPAHYASFNMTQGIKVEGIPAPPRGTSKRGKEFWNATIPALCQMGVISYTDLSQMEALLFAYEALQTSMQDLKKWDSEDKELTKDNIGMRKKLVTIYTAAQANFNTLSAKFGMTPVDRTHLPHMQDDSEITVDPLDQLLGG